MWLDDFLQLAYKFEFMSVSVIQALDDLAQGQEVDLTPMDKEEVLEFLHDLETSGVDVTNAIELLGEENGS